MESFGRQFPQRVVDIRGIFFLRRRRISTFRIFFSLFFFFSMAPFETRLRYRGASFVGGYKTHALLPGSSTFAQHKARTPSTTGNGRSGGSPLLLVQRVVPRTFPETSEKSTFLLSGCLAEITCEQKQLHIRRGKNEKF